MPIGHITLDMKLAGKPYAGKPHVRFEVAVAGDGADDPLEGDTHLKREKRLGLTRSVPLPRQQPTQQIVKIYKESRKTYGSPRIRRKLSKKGIHCGKKRIERLMREAGIQAIQKRKFKVTTDSKHSLPVAENILNREFDAGSPNMSWVSDITYINTDEGWLYLAAVMDLCSRRIVGYSIQKYLTRDLVIEAMKMAVANRHPGRGLIAHSDRGSQYASSDYQRMLQQHGFICSMSRKGNCWDNSPMESFFKTLKVELIYQRHYKRRSDAKLEIFEYIEVFYNRLRLHSALGYESPADFERSYENQSKVA